MLKRIIQRVSESVVRRKVAEHQTAPDKAMTIEKSATSGRRSKPAKEVWVPGGKDKPVDKATGRASSKTAEAPRDGAPRHVHPAHASSEPQDGQGPKRRRRRRRRPRNPENGEPRREGEEASAPKEAARPPHRSDTPRPPKQEKRVYTPKSISSFDGQLAYADMDIEPSLKQALADMHFTVTTPIQAQILPVALAGGDAAGKAQTGTGKTAAFLISIFNRCLRAPIEGERPVGTPRALILAPTRELAIQITKDAEDIGAHTGLKTLAVYGGMDFDKQQRQLEQPVDVVVATPGRLLDFANRKVVHLRQIEMLVIDEADRMLDMGFIPDVRRIVRMTPHPEQRQTLLFSATLTPDIVRMAEQWTRNAVTVEIEPERVAAESVVQRVMITTQDEKFRLLYNLLKTENPDRAIIFSNRRDQAEMLHEHLKSYGFETELLTGAVDQKKRMRVLESFKQGTTRILVATDVAGRGLHVEGISHVFNYHMPMDPDDYVHRIGRTGRAGEFGTSISFACEVDSFAIPDVEAFIGHPLKCEHPTEELLAELPAPNYQVKPKPRKPAGRGPRRGGGGGGGRSGGSRGGRGGGGRR
jgi:ATP-dependent RNA helicase RhlB